MGEMLAFFSCFPHCSLGKRLLQLLLPTTLRKLPRTPKSNADGQGQYVWGGPMIPEGWQKTHDEPVGVLPRADHQQLCRVLVRGTDANEPEWDGDGDDAGWHDVEEKYDRKEGRDGGSWAEEGRRRLSDGERVSIAQAGGAADDQAHRCRKDSAHSSCPCLPSVCVRESLAKASVSKTLKSAHTSRRQVELQCRRRTPSRPHDQSPTQVDEVPPSFWRARVHVMC